MASQKYAKTNRIVEKSIADAVRKSINLKPSVVDALELGIVNYSALARIIGQELGIGKGNTHAILSAIKRYGAGIESKKDTKKINKIIANSTMNIQTDLAVLGIAPNSDVQTVSKSLDVRIYHVIQGLSVLSLVIDAKNPEKIRAIEKKFGPKALRQNLAALTIVSPETVMETPGTVIQYIGPLAINNINIQELLGTANDTIILVRMEDANRVFTIINEVIQNARKQA